MRRAQRCSRFLEMPFARGSRTTSHWTPRTPGPWVPMGERLASLSQVWFSARRARTRVARWMPLPSRCCGPDTLSSLGHLVAPTPEQRHAYHAGESAQTNCRPSIEWHRPVFEADGVFSGRENHTALDVVGLDDTRRPAVDRGLPA